jgi:hypothetical protein
MRKGIMALLVASGVSLAGVSGAAAMPVGAAVLDKALAEQSPITKARVYCYNTDTGQFLHWGPCGDPRWGGPRWGGPRWHHWRHWD